MSFCGFISFNFMVSYCIIKPKKICDIYEKNHLIVKRIIWKETFFT